jgi:lipopolysaccharide transport system permease protein
MTRLPRPVTASTVSHRPDWPLSAACDGLFAVAAYWAAFWLRFHGGDLQTFLGRVWSTTAWVVVGQLTGLVAAGAYARRPRVDWLVRVIAGVTLGTAASAGILAITTGFEGISRTAFVADALLLSIAAVGWRGAWVLHARTRARIATPAPSDEFDELDELIDRAEEMTTLGAVVASVYSYRELLKNLVLKDLKLKYRGSVFGFVWSLANPLMMVIVYTIAFTFILGIRTKGFVFYLMLGQLAYSFFASSAAMSTGAILDNAGLLKSVRFPRAILPIGTVLFNLAQYLLTASVLLPILMVVYRVPPSPPLMLFPVLLALQVLFVIGVALALATATVFFRDVRHLLEVALAMLFWLTPIVYDLTSVHHAGLRLLILLSPMSSFIVAYQKLFFYRQWPDATVWLVAVVYSLGAFVLGSMLILNLEDRFTEQL